MRCAVELSGYNVALAEAELESVLAGTGGRRHAGTHWPQALRWIEVEVADGTEARALLHRLALAHRVLSLIGPFTGPETEHWFASAGREGRSISLRPIGRSDPPLGRGALDAFARAFVAAGGRVDLEHPDRRLFAAPGEAGWTVAETLAETDRWAFGERRMPRMPFQRPVSLPPRLGRVAVNLAGVRPGDRVVDPFVGTGALLLEAAYVGARITGVDRDPAMIRGALANVTAHGFAFEDLAVDDAAAVADRYRGPPFDAIVTDPPYGRASSSAGESPAELVQRVLPRWAIHLRPEGRISVVVPGGYDLLPPPWRCTVCVADRVHRSLTREFRVYERAPTAVTGS